MTTDNLCNRGETDKKTRIIFNPPPSDRRCECCGRHINELKPFGGAGDPLVGDFSGAYLAKKWRSLEPWDEELDPKYVEAKQRFKIDGFKDPMDWLISKYGEEKGNEIGRHAEASHSIEPSWECRDCAVLDEKDHSDRLNERLKKEGWIE